MAHSCPDCGLTCYCGGDIDDCLFDDTDEQDACCHCLGKEFEDDCDDTYEPDDDSWAGGFADNH